MQIFIYCKITLHVSGVTAPIISAATSLQRGPIGPRWREVAALMMGAVTPETCRVILQ